ncbi:MAG: hypothetical protein QM744_17955 [Mesorhizobium sp.]
MRALLRFTGAIICAFLLAGGIAAAREPTDLERQNLAAAVGKFDTAMRGSNLEAIPDSMPPKLFEHIARISNTTVEQLRASMVQQMKALFEAVKVESFSMDVEKAEYLELPGGEPYALIPTETLIDTKTQKVLAKSKTLGLLENDNWYLVRIDEPQQVKILREIYPVFESISLPAGTMEVVK